MCVHTSDPFASFSHLLVTVLESWFPWFQPGLQRVTFLKGSKICQASISYALSFDNLFQPVIQCLWTFNQCFAKAE